MSYNLFLIKEPLYYYSKSILSMMNNLRSEFVAITMDKNYLQNKSPNSIFFERVQQDGSILENSVLIKAIREINPKVVLLDNCIWYQNEINYTLLDALFVLQKEQTFLLINVLPLSVFYDNFSQNIIYREKANKIYYPRNYTYLASWIDICWNKNIEFYEQKELERDVYQLSLPDFEPELYREAYRLFMGIQTLKLRNDFDLFLLFLDKIRVKYSDEHLSKVVFTFYKYFFERTFKKDVGLSTTELNDLFEKLNRPVLLLIFNNRVLFEELLSFFL